jgi:hypothetical protein
VADKGDRGPGGYYEEGIFMHEVWDCGTGTSINLWCSKPTQKLCYLYDVTDETWTLRANEPSP